MGGWRGATSLTLWVLLTSCTSEASAVGSARTTALPFALGRTRFLRTERTRGLLPALTTPVGHASEARAWEQSLERTAVHGSRFRQYMAHPQEHHRALCRLAAAAAPRHQAQTVTTAYVMPSEVQYSTNYSVVPIQCNAVDSDTPITRHQSSRSVVWGCTYKRSFGSPLYLPPHLRDERTGD